MKSSEETVARAYAQIAECDALISRLVAEGKRVVLIADSDGVLTSSDSDALGRVVAGEDSLAKRFELEERLVLEPLRPGPWLRIAERAAAIKAPIYVVTARSTFANPRLLWFCLEYRIPVKWVLGVGHQPKRGSYEIIIREHAADPDCHFVGVDDSTRHAMDFLAVAEGLGVADRAHLFQAIPVFDHTMEEYGAFYDAVMGATSALDAVPVRVPGWKGEFLVVPSRRSGLAHIMMGLRRDLGWEASPPTSDDPRC